MFGHNGTIIKNPINPKFFAGGSSAGSAASVAGNLALSAIGTDTGGSISFPAHCCGLVSLKPSFGRVSRFGVILYSSSNDCPGPFGRSVDDVYEVFRAMQGECGSDSNCIDFERVEKVRDRSKIGDVGLKDLDWK